MGIGCGNTVVAGFNQAECHLLGNRAKATRQRTRSDLKPATGFGKFFDFFGLCHDRLVAFRVGYERTNFEFEQAVDEAATASRNHLVRKLHQHDSPPVHFTQKGHLVLGDEVDKLGTQPNLATHTHLKRDTRIGQLLAKFSVRCFQAAALVVIAVRVHVRGEHRVCNAIGHRHPRELEGFLQGVRAVVHSGQKMAMQINHCTAGATLKKLRRWY